MRKTAHASRYRCPVVFFIRKEERKIVCKLFKDKSEKYILRFYFNVDAALKTPVFECEVCPNVNENVLKILDEFASEYKPTENGEKGGIKNE